MKEKDDLINLAFGNLYVASRLISSKEDVEEDEILSQALLNIENARKLFKGLLVEL